LEIFAGDRVQAKIFKTMIYFSFRARKFPNGEIYRNEYQLFPVYCKLGIRGLTVSFFQITKTF